MLRISGISQGMQDEINKALYIAHYLEVITPEEYDKAEKAYNEYAGKTKSNGNS